MYEETDNSLTFYTCPLLYHVAKLSEVIPLFLQHFPPGEKYVALYPSSTTTSAKALQKRGIYNGITFLQSLIDAIQNSSRISTCVVFGRLIPRPYNPTLHYLQYEGPLFCTASDAGCCHGLETRLAFVVVQAWRSIKVTDCV